MMHLCFVRPIRDGADLETYVNVHRPGRTPAAVVAALRRSGIVDCRIFRSTDRLVMTIAAEDDFSMERAARMNADDAEVQAWNRLIASLLQGEGAGSKLWSEAARLFDLSEHSGPAAGSAG